jgi:predicted CXXCH cytochrome family protein
MSFIIRQIAKRADGGDIIRTRTLTDAEISVGRGTDADIQLADLGIMLRHAKLTQLAGGLVAVEATGGIPLEIDGKFVNRAELVAADGPTINMASHRLTLAAGESADDVAITAERVIAASDAADGASEVEIFSLNGAMPTKRTMAWTLGLLVLGFGLIWPTLTLWGRGDVALPQAMVADAARATPASATSGGLQPALGADAPAPLTGMQPDIVWNSGPMSGAHAGSSYSCGSCHQEAFVATSDASCVACHKPDVVPDHAAMDRMRTGRFMPTGGLAAAGLAIQQAAGLEPGRCASCHKEHEGPGGALMVEQSFCTDCHTGLDERLSDTALGNVEGWDEHPQFKPTLVAKASDLSPRFERVSLDVGPKEASGLIYPHDLHMSKTNSVANMVEKQGLPAKDGALGCNYCHMNDSDGVRFKPIEMEANCSACHDLSFARDGSVVRTLPHGKAAQVAGIVRDFYLSQAVAPRAGVQRLAFERRADERRLPGEMAEAEARDLRVSSAAEARVLADAAVNQIFSKDGVCADCHMVSRTDAANLAERWQVAPVTINDHYLPKGLFPHGQHDSYDGKTGDAACVACHTGVPKSKLATDVLLPKIEGCRDCHGSGDVKTNVAATCDTCHGYHFGTDLPVPAALKVAGGHGGGDSGGGDSGGGDSSGHGTAGAGAWQGPERSSVAGKAKASAGVGG